MTKTVMLQMPNNIIRNPSLTCNEFACLSFIQLMLFRLDEKNKEIIVNVSELKKFLNMHDNRTIKSIFANLYEKKFIATAVNRIPKNSLLTIEVNLTKLSVTNGFTQLPQTIINYMPNITTIGFRLMFYYMSFINPKRQSSFAFPSFDKICNEVNITAKSLAKYNSILEKQKLIQIKRHKLMPEGYTEDDKIAYTKYNNHYYVLLNNLIK